MTKHAWFWWQLAEARKTLASLPPWMLKPTKEATMGRIDRWCIMCGAAPGEPCTVISGGDGLAAGDVRTQVHFYRFNTEKPACTVKEEPDFAELLDLDPALADDA